MLQQRGSLKHVFGLFKAHRERSPSQCAHMCPGISVEHCLNLSGRVWHWITDWVHYAWDERSCPPPHPRPACGSQVKPTRMGVRSSHNGYDELMQKENPAPSQQPNRFHPGWYVPNMWLTLPHAPSSYPPVSPASWVVLSASLDPEGHSEKWPRSWSQVNPGSRLQAPHSFLEPPPSTPGEKISEENSTPKLHPWFPSKLHFLQFPVQPLENDFGVTSYVRKLCAREIGADNLQCSGDATWWF